jgi:hypothetical protein
MSNAGNFQNNPLYTDITKLDNLSPQPTFAYNWNGDQARWEPASSTSGVGSTSLENLDDLISGFISGLSGYNTGGSIVSGNVNVSGLTEAISELSNSISGIGSFSGEISISGLSESISELSASISNIGSFSGDLNVSGLNESISGLSDKISNLSGLNESISGLSDKIANLSGINVNQEPSFKLCTKTVDQKIEEDFILMESIPDSIRLGEYSGNCYGQDKSLMDDIFNTYYANARNNPSLPETGHPNYFIFPEDIDENRCIESKDAFHTDTQYALRFDNQDASLINSYELKDFGNLYESGLAESVTIYNDSPYPIQFHTLDKNYTFGEENIIYLYGDTSVTLTSDEAARIYVKRPHTISGFNVKYSITYKETGASTAYNI